MKKRVIPGSVRAWTALIACALLAVAACVPSLYPLYTEKDLIFDSDLLGTWSGKGTTWTVTQQEGKKYKIVLGDVDKKAGAFVAHLVKLGDQRFLDLFPLESGGDDTNFYRLHWRPMHTFIKITREDDAVKVAYMRRGWIAEAVKKNPALIKYESPEGGIILTAPTADLQKLILDNLNDPKFFYEYAKLKRVAAPELKPGGKGAKISNDQIKNEPSPGKPASGAPVPGF